MALSDGLVATEFILNKKTAKSFFITSLVRNVCHVVHFLIKIVWRNTFKILKPRSWLPHTDNQIRRWENNKLNCGVGNNPPAETFHLSYILPYVTILSCMCPYVLNKFKPWNKLLLYSLQLHANWRKSYSLWAIFNYVKK